MHHHRLTRIATLALAIGALAAPTAIAQQDLRSPDAIDAAQQTRQNLRSPNAIDAAGTAEAQQDKRSPDARDAAEGRGAYNTPEVVFVKAPHPAHTGGSPLGRRRHRRRRAARTHPARVGRRTACVHRRHTRPIRASDCSTDPALPWGRPLVPLKRTSRAGR